MRSRVLATVAIVALLSLTTAGIAVADPPDDSGVVTTTATEPTAEPTLEPTSPPESTSGDESPAPTGSAPAATAAVSIDGEFDAASYRVGDDIGFTLRITNHGSDRIAGIRIAKEFAHGEDLQLPYRAFGDLEDGYDQPGATIEAGQTVERTVTGHVGDLRTDSVVVAGFLYEPSGHSVGTFSFAARVESRTEPVSGVVYGDANGNGRLDDGEGLAGVPLTLTYLYAAQNAEHRAVSATSGAGGVFDFGDVPTAEYRTGGFRTSGFSFPFGRVTIAPGEDHTDQLVRGAPSLGGALSATMAFTQDVYAPGDLAHVTVTLTNSGRVPMVGVVVACNRIGDPDHLTGTGPGWGDLAGAGVTIAPGQTSTFDVSEVVPQAAQDSGLFLASCDFGYDGVDIDNHAFADDEAKVPGGRALVVVKAFTTGEAGESIPLAGTGVTLVNTETCQRYGTRVTGGDGLVRFVDVPPGRDYKAYVRPTAGWRLVGDNPVEVWVSAPGGEQPLLSLSMERGEVSVPTVPHCATPPSTSPSTRPPVASSPVPQGRSGGLADTGASVIGLTALGLLLVGVGGGSVVLSRRRRPTAE